MIDLYFWPTPNGFKITIALEEMGLPYTVTPIDIGGGKQFEPAFLKISPNNKMPAIVDPNGPNGKPVSVFESGAILLYLAEKTGQFLPTDPRARIETLEWSMWQMGGLGPMLGQAHHFRFYAPEQNGYAIDRYTNEGKRLYGVLDRRLADNEWLVGDDYTIADMAAFPWTRSYEKQGIDLAEFPHVKRWFDANNARPAVQKALTVLAENQRGSTPITDEEREIMFGNAQYQRR